MESTAKQIRNPKDFCKCGRLAIYCTPLVPMLALTPAVLDALSRIDYEHEPAFVEAIAEASMP